MVSVIIPSYNRADIILPSVQSVLDQTYRDIEVLVVDDCSTDNTEEVIRSIKDERVKYFCMERNSGACAARNRGIEEAKGEYIAFQDSDDIWRPDKLTKQISVLETTDADFVGCRMKRFVLGSTDRFTYYPGKKAITEKDMTFDSVLYKNCISTQALVGKRECFENVKFDVNIKRFQDWDITISLLIAGYKMGFVDDIEVDSYIKEDSITNSNERTEQGRIDFYNKYKKYIDANPRTHARVVERFGDSKRIAKKRKESKALYEESLRIRPTWKPILKWLYVVARLDWK